MKNLKKLALVAFFTVAFAGISNAQFNINRKVANTPEKAATEIVNQLNSVVTLTKDQSPKVYQIVLKLEQGRSKIQNSRMDVKQKQAQIRSLREEAEKEFKSIATPDQLKKWETYKREHATKR